MDRREGRRVTIRPLSAVGESEETGPASDRDAASRLAASKENNKFEILCDGVVNSVSETQASLQDLLQLKDSLLLHYLPPPMLFRLAITVGKVYRAFSDMNTPVNELVRLVRIYSLPWDQNSVALKRLHDMYENKKQMLNIAIKRLTLVDKKTKLFEREKRLTNWERLYVKLSESKGHGRRWKFRIDTFRKKANEGYDELLKWVKSEGHGNLAERKVQVEKKDEKKTETEKSVKSDDSEDEKLDDSVGDIGSDDESFLSKSSRAKSAKKAETPKPIPTTAEISTQTQPDVEEKQCWTGEPDYIRYFIVRLFKPSGLALTKLKCRIRLGETQFTSKYLDPPKTEKKVKVIETKKKGRLIGNKGKKSDEIEEKDTKAEESIQNYQDFVFTIDDQFKRKGILDISDNSVTFEITHGDDEAVFAYSKIQMDDLHSLDLPILYYKMPSEVKVIDFYSKDETKDDSIHDLDIYDWLKYGEFTDESKASYEMLSERQPLLFPMHKDKTAKVSSTDAIGNLPIMLFWARKPVINRFEKNTGTQSIRDIVEECTGFDINKINRFEIDQLMNKSLRDSMCSPMSQQAPPRPPSTPAGIVKMSVEEIENMKREHAKEILGVHETFQLQVDQLKLTISELEDELGQLRSIHELKNEGQEKNRGAVGHRRQTRNKIDKQSDLSKKSTQQKPEPAIRHLNSMYGKDLPEDFLERLKMFSDKSTAHQKELIKKYFEEESSIREQQMSVQHRLDSSKQQEPLLTDDFCLPAVFMPYKSGNNIFNPKAHQYFHPSGYTDLRLTQPPSVFQLPPLPSKSVPVINLFELSKRYQSGEPDFYISQYVNSKMNAANEKTNSNNSNINSNRNNVENQSELSNQKPNSLASKNNTIMRLDFVINTNGGNGNYNDDEQRIDEDDDDDSNNNNNYNKQQQQQVSGTTEN